MNALRLLPGLAALLALSVLSCAAEPFTSEYTSTKGGVVLEKTKPGEPGDYLRKQCPGLGGYKVLYLADDARSWLEVQYGKAVSDLRQQTFAQAPGAPGGFPKKANDVVEWRGVVHQGVFVPYALIYRLEGEDERTGKRKTRLIVIKLDRAQSAVVGYAEGKDEDAEARRIADRSRPK